MPHKKPRSFDSVFKGTKSKEVLEQEIWSLVNSANSIMTTSERANWYKNYSIAIVEYSARFGINILEDILDEWSKWAKK